jgi:23S rRNA (cytosine1962-C5)-methyltransferase
LPDGPFEVREHGMKLLVDVVQGQKTGLFLDHRPSRWRVRQLSRDLEVLNLYGYTGAFSVAAGLGGARAVDTVDLAAPALGLAERSWALNLLGPKAHRCHAADVPAYLEGAAREGRRWDLVIADPPSFAARESAVEAAVGAYRKLHAACLGLLRPGGLYLGASCSSHVRREAFEQTLLDAAGKLRRPLQLLDSWSAGPDHPRLPAFPEGDYLKAVLVRA